jgi:hypothetical protein
LDFFFALNWGRELLKALNNLINCHLDSSSEVHWVHSCGNRFASLLEDGSGENSGGGGTISSFIVSLGSNLLNKTGSNVVISISELDFFGNGDSIFGDFWCAESLVNDHVSTSWAQGNLDGVSEHIGSFEHESSGLSSELDFLT